MKFKRGIKSHSHSLTRHEIQSPCTVDPNHHQKREIARTDGEASPSVGFNERSLERSARAFILSRTIPSAHILEIFIRWHSHGSQLINDRQWWSSWLNELELRETHPTATSSEQTTSQLCAHHLAANLRSMPLFGVKARARTNLSGEFKASSTSALSKTLKHSSLVRSLT